MYLGIDIGGTNLKSGIIDESGRLVFNTSQPTNAASGRESVLASLLELIAQMVKQFPLIKTIGTGVPGVVNEQGVIGVSPNLPGWNHVPLLEILRERFSLPLAVDNDANAASLAELFLGAGRDLDDFIYVTLGTGVGGTIIHQRKIYRGASGGAGEIGHTIIDMSRENEAVQVDFRTGTLEEMIGRGGILKLAEDLTGKYPGTSLNNYENPDVEDISREAANGDKASTECLETAGKYLGIGLASAMNLLDVTTAIIGGGISQVNPVFWESAIKTLKHRSLPVIAEKAEIRKAHFLADAGVIGAALLGKNFSTNIDGNK